MPRHPRKQTFKLDDDDEPELACASLPPNGTAVRPIPADVRACPERTPHRALAYQDRLDYRYPAIRFRKEDNVSGALRLKDKGDWKTLSAEDKKLLYPAIPPTFQDEYKGAQVQRQLVREKGYFLGPAKYYDYENNQWKK